MLESWIFDFSDNSPRITFLPFRLNQPIKLGFNQMVVFLRFQKIFFTQYIYYVWAQKEVIAYQIRTIRRTKHYFLVFRARKVQCFSLEFVEQQLILYEFSKFYWRDFWPELPHTTPANRSAWRWGLITKSLRNFIYSFLSWKSIVKLVLIHRTQILTS